MSGRLRPYEPLLMTLHRVIDALLGGYLFYLLSKYYYAVYTPDYSNAALFIFLITILCFHLMGLYHSWRVASLRHEIHQIILGCVTIYVLLLLVGYSLKISDIFSRRVVLTWMTLWPIIMGAERFIIRVTQRHYMRKGHNIKRAVIAGTGEMGDRLIRWVNENPWSGTEVIGFFDDHHDKEELKGYALLGNLDRLPQYVREEGIDTVYMSLSMKEESKLLWLLKELADSTASVYFVPDILLYDLMLGGNLMYFDNIPVIALRDTPLRGFNALLKRMEDLVLAGMALLLVSPLMFLICLGIKLTSKGTIFFAQWRYGLDGKPFMVYKFRTMAVSEDGYHFHQVTRYDPRVTRLGALLRRTSLDELPQFINVLQGRMSIVGPRPHPVALNEEFRKLVPGYMLRHKVKPGITGLAQINGWRGETDTLEKMEKRIEYDLEYLRQWSLFLDLKIIFQTLWNNTWRSGAY